MLASQRAAIRGKLARAPSYKGAKMSLKKNWKSCASKLKIPHAKEFIRNLPAIWARALKNIHQSSTRPKMFKE
jgi:hypothetical protein